MSNEGVSSASGVQWREYSHPVKDQGAKRGKRKSETAEKTGIPQKTKEVFRVDPKRRLVSDCPLKRTVFSLCEVKPSVLVCGVS